MIPASVYIIALNEEAHIGRALESVKDFKDIVVIDSGSTDKTKEISKTYTDNVIEKDWIDEFDQRSFALTHCSEDWVLSLDADEEVNDELKSFIKATIEADNADALDVEIREYFMGRVHHKGVKYSHRVKAFKRSKFNYGEARVHIPQLVAGKTIKARGFITHFGEKSVALAVQKNNKYSSLKARDNFEKNKFASRLRIIAIVPLVFLKYYLAKRHFMSGMRGFILSVNCAHYAFLKEAKLYELHHSEKQ